MSSMALAKTYKHRTNRNAVHNAIQFLQVNESAQNCYTNADMQDTQKSDRQTTESR